MENKLKSDIDPFHVSCVFLHPLKSIENQRLLCVLRGRERNQSYKMG